MVDDDLEDEFQLRLRGKKADLIEVADVLHEGHHTKAANGKYTPPDHSMIRELVGDLHDELDVGGANQAMVDRLEDEEYIVGEEVEPTLVRVSDD